MRDAGGPIEGVTDIATETTRHVIDRRRFVMLNRLRELLGSSESVQDVLERALRLLRENRADMPEVAIEPGHARLDAEEVAGELARFPLGIRRAGDRAQPVLVVRLSGHLARTAPTSRSCA